MTSRPQLVPLAVLLAACLAVFTACKKKPSDGDGPAPDPAPSPPAPSAVSSDYVLFAHLRTKDVRDSAIFKGMMQAFAKAGTADWDRWEDGMIGEIGVKPTDIDAVTVCVTELPNEGRPKMVVILASSTPINKAAAFRLGPRAKPDARGFYKGRGQDLIHFPDDKTTVMIHPDLAQRYLDGYAKDRNAWPANAGLTRAATGHTLFATVNLEKVPAEIRNEREAKEFEALLAARTVTLTADLKGKALSVSARASFPDAAAAGRAKEKAQELIGMATAEVEKAMTGKKAGELGALEPAVKAAHRALKAARVEASGSELTAAASYNADFDIASVSAEAVKRWRESAARMKASNDLKMIGLALQNYEAATNRLLVHGIGPKGAPLKNAKEKPLLSWRVALLPYLDIDGSESNLYRQFKLDEPWDSEHNKKLIDKMPKFYAPAKPGKPGYTHMQMVIGPGAMQPVGTSLANMTDGTSNTIAVVEAAEPVIWTKPDDVMLPGKELPKDLRKKFGGQFPGGFNVVMWDSSVRFVHDSVSDRTLGLLLNPRDGTPIPNDW